MPPIAERNLLKGLLLAAFLVRPVRKGLAFFVAKQEGP